MAKIHNLESNNPNLLEQSQAKMTPKIKWFQIDYPQQKVTRTQDNRFYLKTLTCLLHNPMEKVCSLKKLSLP